MKIFEGVCIGVGLALLALMLLFIRREVISRGGGTIEMYLRLNTFVPERGWSPGLGRFAGNHLRWYRIFSFAVRPRRVLSRGQLTVENRRAPEGEERLALPAGYVIVRCAGGAEPVEIALAESTLTGFLSWLESAPPVSR
ncbi:DUF2550 domain-containing protein [Luedemannella helvata]|uniref:DUF2550 domain-containing protein n=1 Tax=Luedemannella helvata TaxID=349315 RepID=A0ABP4WAZ8_9ACTN